MFLKKSKSDPTFRKRTTVALILYIFLIIWTYIHDEAIVLVLLLLVLNFQICIVYKLLFMGLCVLGSKFWVYLDQNNPPKSNAIKKATGSQYSFFGLCQTYTMGAVRGGQACLGAERCGQSRLGCQSTLVAFLYTIAKSWYDQILYLKHFQLCLKDKKTHIKY